MIKKLKINLKKFLSVNLFYLKSSKILHHIKHFTDPQKLKYSSNFNIKTFSFLSDSIDLPYVLPWEACPALQSQTGMSAFGTQRDPKTKVDQGHIELVQVGELLIIFYFLGTN